MTPTRGIQKVGGSIVICVLFVLTLGIRAGAAQPVTGWPTFRDGQIEVSHPPGWRLQRDAPTGRLLIQGPQNEGLVIWPFFVDGTLTSVTAAQVLMRMAQGQLPRLTWGPAQPAGQNALRSDGRSGAEAATASLAWTPSKRGTAVHFVMAGAPPGRRRESEESFTKILASLRLTGRRETPSSGGSAPPPDVSYVQFRDPNEGAFSLEVPRGWRVSGGLVRKAPVDVRSSVVATSPDNRMALRLGDANLPPFALPTPQLTQLGFREGSAYSPGYGVNMIVMPYLSGEQFARYYIVSRVGQVCAGPQIVSMQALPQTVQAMNAIMARYGSAVLSQRLHAGDAAFRCQQGQAPMVGYLFVATLLTAGANGGGNWSVDQLQGYLSPPELAGSAQAVLAHMVGSVRLNPEWARMQQNIAANTSRIVADTGAHISKVISDSYWSRQASQDEMSRRRSNATLGVEDVRDPATGREIKVESGSSYYWMDHRGNIAGTDIYNRPSVDFRELVRLP